MDTISAETSVWKLNISCTSCRFVHSYS